MINRNPLPTSGYATGPPSLPAYRSALPKFATVHQIAIDSSSAVPLTMIGHMFGFRFRVAQIPLPNHSRTVRHTINTDTTPQCVSIGNRALHRTGAWCHLTAVRCARVCMCVMLRLWWGLAGMATKKKEKTHTTPSTARINPLEQHKERARAIVEGAREARMIREVFNRHAHTGGNTLRTLKQTRTGDS